VKTTSSGNGVASPHGDGVAAPPAGNGAAAPEGNGAAAPRADAPRPRTRKAHPLLGWREWVAFPEHGALWIKAKVDTGARTSAIHARNVKLFVHNGQDWVRFTVLPWQSSNRDAVELEARLEEQRWIRSSNGHREYRPVVLLPVQIAGRTHVVEFTLSHRPQMGFRILLGRQALRGHYQVDPGQSYLGERPPTEVKVRNKTKRLSE
jgi:hypothetical protein